jgi:hypothetical protein
MRPARVVLFAVAALVVLPHAARAQPRPGLRVDLTLEPSAPGLSATIGGNANGIQVMIPEHTDSMVTFGLGAGIGGLVTRHVELGAMVNLGVANGGGDTVTLFGLRPFFKLNLWSTKHVNPFFQPFLGFVLLDGEETWVYLDGGFYVGVDLLVTTWGVRIYTGFEAIHRNDVTTYGVPIKWALVAYF